MTQTKGSIVRHDQHINASSCELGCVMSRAKMQAPWNDDCLFCLMSARAWNGNSVENTIQQQALCRTLSQHGLAISPEKIVHIIGLQLLPLPVRLLQISPFPVADARASTQRSFRKHPWGSWEPKHRHCCLSLLLRLLDFPG